MNDFFDVLSYAARYETGNIPTELMDEVRDAVFNAINDASHKPTAKVEEDWDDDTPELDSFLTDLTVTEAK